MGVKYSKGKQYINIDFEEIVSTLRFLDSTGNRNNPWKRFAPSIVDIDRLFVSYDCVEFCENFYDSEPEYNDEEFHMYMDYLNVIKEAGELPNGTITGTLFWELLMGSDKETHRYSKQQHTLKEYKKAYDKILRLNNEYNVRRIKHCNWQEPYFNGNWGMSQEYVNTLAKNKLYAVKKSPIHKWNRLWILTTKKRILVYYYGRDYQMVDYVWAFEKHPQIAHK